MLSGPHTSAVSCLSGLPKCASESCSQKCIFLATPARHQQRRSVRDQSRIAPTQRPTIRLWSRLTGLRQKREAGARRLRHTLASLAWVLDEPSRFLASARTLSAPKKRRKVSRPPAAPAHADLTPALQGRPRSLVHPPRPPPVCTFALPTWITRNPIFFRTLALPGSGGPMGQTQVVRPGCGPDLARKRAVTGCQSLSMGTKLWAPRSLHVRRPAGGGA